MAQTFSLSDPADCSKLEGVVCAIGVFDGVHLGHRLLISDVIRAAEDAGTASAVVTFDIDPDELFKGERFAKLQGNDERLVALAALDVDFVAVIPFTREFASLEPDEFLDEFFGCGMPSQIFVGSDFRFGKGAKGDAAMLERWGKAHGVSVHPIDLLAMDGDIVKSTRIRELLMEGDVEEASRLLGHPYAISGEVLEGRGEGADMGFATANLQTAQGERVLADGVYGGYAIVDDTRYKAAISVGVTPTFADKSTHDIEVHLLGFEGDLYGKQITVEFLKRMRPMIKFDDVSELIATVKRDISWIEQNL